MATILPARTVGPFVAERDGEMLRLTLPSKGTLTPMALAFFLFSMVCILIVGLFATLRSAQFGMQDAGDFFSPRRNHFGVMWGLSTLGMLVGFPLYISRAYRAPVTFTFNGRNGTIFKDNQLITRFGKVEYLQLREARDPDTKFLYAVSLFYNDGLELPIHEVYEEREAGNLANEIATFVHCGVRWR